jgi:hypothetical protein
MRAAMGEAWWQRLEADSALARDKQADALFLKTEHEKIKPGSLVVWQDTQHSQPAYGFVKQILAPREYVVTVLHHRPSKRRGAAVVYLDRVTGQKNVKRAYYCVVTD